MAKRNVQQAFGRDLSYGVAARPIGPKTKRQFSRERNVRPGDMPQRGFNVGDAKFLDIAQATYDNNTTGSITHLDVVPRGTGVNARIGKAFVPTSLQIQGHVSTDSESATVHWANYLVWDLSPNQALPAITDILDAGNSLAFPKRENSHRFKIIRRFHGVLSGPNSTATGQEQITDVQEYVRMPKGIVSMCTSTDEAGTIGSRVTGALYLISTGNKGAGTVDATSTLTMRLNYME